MNPLALKTRISLMITILPLDAIVALRHQFPQAPADARCAKP